MFTKELLKFTVVKIFGTIFFLNALNAIEIKTTFYPENSIPQKYYVPNNGDLTLLTLEGWPENSVISVSQKRLSNPEYQSVKPICSGTGSAPQLCVYTLGYIPGEPVTYKFQDIKKALSTSITFVPSPLRASSVVDNASITATIDFFSPPFNYTLTFKGFKDTEALIMQSASYDEKMDLILQGDLLQETIFYSPEVINKQGGIALLSFKRPSGEVLKLELPWGIEWVKYSLYMDNGKPKSIVENEEFLKENPVYREYFKYKRV